MVWLMQDDGTTDEVRLASCHQTLIHGHSTKMMDERYEPPSSYYLTDMQLL